MRTTVKEFCDICRIEYPNRLSLTLKEIKELSSKHHCTIPSRITRNPVDPESKYRREFWVREEKIFAQVSVPYTSKTSPISEESWKPVVESLALVNSEIDDLPEEQNSQSESEQHENQEDSSEILPESEETLYSVSEKIELPNTEYEKFIPKPNELFVPYGVNYKLIDKIIATYDFLPMYIYGISGIGKTMQIEQACAIRKRPFFRCQITKDTTNEDLIGSYALINGNTVWNDGPVLKAYRCGGILLLDEIDLNSSLMFLQVVLENKPIYIIQTGELVYPEKGFNVFATGNTKGDGSDSRFTGTSVLNDAFLERFVTIIEQTIPSIGTEKKIIMQYIKCNNITINDNLLASFIAWIQNVRQIYESGDTDIYISTRRIQFILKLFSMTHNFRKSVEVVLARYPEEQKEAFLMAWNAFAE